MLNKQLIGSKLALFFGASSMLSGLGTAAGSEGNSADLITGPVMVLGAVAYSSRKRRLLGLRPETTIRQTFEVLCLCLIGTMWLGPPDLRDAIRIDPIPHLMVPLWALIAYPCAGLRIGKHPGPPPPEKTVLSWILKLLWTVPVATALIVAGAATLVVVAQTTGAGPSDLLILTSASLIAIWLMVRFLDHVDTLEVPCDTKPEEPMPHRQRSHSPVVRAEPELSVDQLKPLAAAGDAAAQTELGLAHVVGTGVSCDIDEAVRWLRQAADQGNPAAQARLGYLYENGEGVLYDPEEAVYWHRKAADQGNYEGQRQLGNAYAYGRGVGQDYVQAVLWYHRAAEQGDVEGQVQLGTCFLKGFGVPQNTEKAALWFGIAAAEGDEDAKRLLHSLRPPKPGLCVKVLILGETQGPPCGTNVVYTNV